MGGWRERHSGDARRRLSHDFLQFPATAPSVIRLRMQGLSAPAVVEIVRNFLEGLINEYKIYHADDRLKKKLDLAGKLPFTDTQEEAEALARAILALQDEAHE